MTQLNLTEVIGEPRSWSPKANPSVTLHSYKVKDDKGTVYEINRKPESGPPKLGLDEYEITPPKEGTDFPPKLKKVGNYGGGGGGGKSPEVQRAIQRQHSQEMAVRTVALSPQYATEASTPDEFREFLADTLRPLIDWFDEDTNLAAAGPDVKKKVEEVAQSVSANPKPEPDSGDRAPSRETVREAYETFIEKASDKQSAKNLVKLQTAALDIKQDQEMNEEQRTKLYEFLTSDAQ